MLSSSKYNLNLHVEYTNTKADGTALITYIEVQAQTNHVPVDTSQYIHV